MSETQGETELQLARILKTGAIKAFTMKSIKAMKDMTWTLCNWAVSVIELESLS